MFPYDPLTMSSNTFNCMIVINKMWKYQNVVDEWNRPEYKWGLTHGDFHPGNVMVNPNDMSDMIMLDWEFSGVMGNPAIDMASWIALIPNDFAELHERSMVEAYYKALIDEGVDNEDYMFEDLWKDFGIYGAGQMFSRYVYFGGFKPTDPKVVLVTTYIDDFFTRHNLTPLKMKAPVYGCVDDYV